jgi:predicted acyltransferase
MRLAPVPGIGTGVLEPGNNFAAYVDSLFLEGHMSPRYKTWDPQGLFSTIPAVGTTLFGVLAGNWLRSPESGPKKTVGMICAGAALLIVGMILDRWLPINKNIWTSTFSVLMAGLALLSLALFYWLIDVKGDKRWAMVFVIFGMNSIAIYFASEILDTSLESILLNTAGSTMSLRAYLHGGSFAMLASQEIASLLFAIFAIVLMFLIAWMMWRREWFIKV